MAIHWGDYMKKIWLAGPAFVLGMAGWGTAEAESVEKLAAAFGARQDITDISLAPGGALAAIVAPSGGRGDKVMIADLVKGGAPRTILNASGQGEHVSYCSWPSDAQLVCSILVQDKSTGNVLSFSRLLSLSLDGSPAKMLTQSANSRSLGVARYGGDIIDWQGGKPEEVLMLRQYIPENTIGTRLAQSGEGLGVESLNVRTLRRATVEKPNRTAAGYITDGMGNIRIMASTPAMGIGYDRNYTDYFYRLVGQHGWNPLGRVTVNPSGTYSGFRPVAVDPESNSVFGFDNKNGFSALYRQSLDGSNRREEVISKPGVDVDELIRIGRSRRVVGVSFATDYRQIEYFDPKLAALRSALSKALPGDPSVTIVDSSADESKLLMFVGSDIDPGKYYIFDKATRKLEEVLPLRTAMSGRTLSPMKSIQFRASDGTMVPAYLTLPPGSDGKNLPAIIMPHGGPSARDEWGFDWLVQFFAARGFAVLQPNFRGSSGYGEAWFEKNGFQSWRTAVGDVTDAGDWLVSNGIAAKGKLAIFGWSYGGYAALQSGVLKPDLFKAIIAVAPVTDLQQLRNDHLNYSDYKLVDAMIGNGPHVSQGSPAQNAAKIQAPVLMFHGDWDTNVDIDQSELMQRRLLDAGKRAELVTFKGLTHSLVEGEARARMLAQSDAFLRENLGMPKE